MYSILKGIKKFAFFDIEKPEKSENQKTLNYTLNDIEPIQLKIYDNYYYVAGKLKSKKENKDLFRIFKLCLDKQVIAEYIPFTDSIIDFDLVNNEGRPFLVVLGTDLRNKDDVPQAEVEINGNSDEVINKIIVKPSPNSVPSIKFYDLSNYQTKSEEKSEDKVFKFVDIIYLIHKKDKPLDFYKGNDLSGLTDAYAILSPISCFCVSPRLNAISFSVYDSIIEIKIDFYKKEKYKFFFINLPNKALITNIKYIISSGDCILYFTTKDTIYYKKSNETKFNIIGDEHIHSGANPKNFDINSKGDVILSTPNTNLIEYYNYNNGTYERLYTKMFERPIRFIQFYQRYYLFVLYDDNKPVLSIYDPRTTSFATFDESFKTKDILFILSKNERIYILFTGSKSKDIICLKEFDNKKKFDIFYEKQFYDFAYSYGKTIGLDKNQLAEIAKAHAEFLYKKGDLENSIEKYKLTINYLDPNYVIKNFLEDSKKNFLIKYLEELQINEQFKNNCNNNNSKRFMDFTALLLYCYIKQNQIEKLKDFVEKQTIDDDAIIKTTIEVCKDTNNIDLALSIAQQKEKNDIYIQILIETKKDYKGSLKYINEIKNIKQKFDILSNYGQKLLEDKEISEQVNVIISNLIFDIINLKRQNKDEIINNLKYEKIISIYSSKENEDKLEVLLEKIMEIEKQNCPKEIILRAITLYQNKYLEKEKIEKNSGNEYVDKIKKILQKFNDIIDKSNLLMSFKISGFDKGVEELYKIMNLDQALLRIYMEKKDFKKINEFCRNSTQENKDKDLILNNWQQALNYYFEISNETNKDEISEYIIEILDYLSKQEEFSPMNFLDLLEKAANNKNKVIEIKEIKKFFKDWIKQKKDALEDDKVKTQENMKKIEDYNKNVKDIKSSAKNYNINRCSSCRGPLDFPFVYFICGHGYHQSCLDDNYDHFECPVCKSKNTQIFDKLEEGKKCIQEPSKYNEELTIETKGDKFDIFANFLGKGVFNEINNSDSNNN